MLLLKWLEKEHVAKTRGMLGLSQRATDTFAAALVSVLTFLVLIVVYVNSKTSLSQQAVVWVLMISIAVLAGSFAMFSLAESRETCLS